ncbi:hypothetical protein D3C78_1509710 [compost metagenome]
MKTGTCLKSNPLTNTTDSFLAPTFDKLMPGNKFKAPDTSCLLNISIFSLVNTVVSLPFLPETTTSPNLKTRSTAGKLSTVCAWAEKDRLVRPIKK